MFEHAVDVMGKELGGGHVFSVEKLGHIDFQAGNLDVGREVIRAVMFHRVDEDRRNSKIGVPELVDEELDGGFIVFLRRHIGVVHVVGSKPLLQSSDKAAANPSAAEHRNNSKA